MKEDENIVSYFIRVDEIVNTLKGLGETILEEAIVHKVLISLPLRFDSKLSVLEDINDIDTVTMERSMGFSLPTR